MIVLTCSDCSKTMEIDDAFAGGVCRCRNCGAIQTVPSASHRPRSRAASPLHDRPDAPPPPARRPIPQVPPINSASLTTQPVRAQRHGDRMLVLSVGLAALVAVLSTTTALTVVASHRPDHSPAPAPEPASLASLLH